MLNTNLIRTHINPGDAANPPFWVAKLAEYGPDQKIINLTINFGSTRREAINKCALDDLRKWRAKAQITTI